MKFKHLLTAVLISVLFLQCDVKDHSLPNVTYQAEVANAWMRMQIRLTRSTAGYNSFVSNRSFCCAGSSALGAKTGLLLPTVLN